MITIENKLMSVPKQKEEGKEDSFFTCGELILLACGQSATPVSLADQRIRFKIMDAIEASNGTIELDEKWIPVLMGCLENIAITPPNRDFVSLADTLDSKTKI